MEGADFVHGILVLEVEGSDGFIGRGLVSGELGVFILDGEDEGGEFLGRGVFEHGAAGGSAGGLISRLAEHSVVVFVGNLSRGDDLFCISAVGRSVDEDMKMIDY